MADWRLEGKEEGPERSPLFVAAFESPCNECGEDIEEGDQAGFVDGEVCCEGCWEEAG